MFVHTRIGHRALRIHRIKRCDGRRGLEQRLSAIRAFQCRVSVV